jgi:hypothetical protein
VIPNPPEVAALVLNIPDSCRLRGEFVDLPHLDDELSIRLVLGNSGDGLRVQFARSALKALRRLGGRSPGRPTRRR